MLDINEREYMVKSHAGASTDFRTKPLGVETVVR
jgi:hypothetical protein